jgi:hypothetical protein
MPDAEFEEFDAQVIIPSRKPSLAKLTNPWADSPPQTFEAVPIEMDPLSGAANQRVAESEWGATGIDDEPSTTDFAQLPIGEWQELLNDSLTRAFQFKSPEEAQGRLNRSILMRKGSPQLRTKLLQLYDRRCAMSRCTVEDVLEVAYIVPFLGDHTNNLNNLILLRSDLHVLFDLHLIAIDPNDLTLHIAPWMEGSYYSILKGRSLHLPMNPDLRPDPALLLQHWQACEWEHEESWPTTYAF